jgi:hypothetical protein
MREFHARIATTDLEAIAERLKKTCGQGGRTTTRLSRRLEHVRGATKGPSSCPAG